MFNLKPISVLFIFVFIYLVSFSQESGLNFISAEDLKQYLSFIASDSLQGRSFETTVNGPDIAADYLKKHIKQFGLKDATDGYFQPVPVISVTPDFDDSFFELQNKKGKTVFKTDSVIILNSENNFELNNAEIVFAGFGYKNEKTGYDDFAGLDLRGKVVIFSIGTPELFLKNEKSGFNNRLENEKAERAFGAGAALVILTDNPQNNGNAFYNRLKQLSSRSNYQLQLNNAQPDKSNTLFFWVSQADAVFGKKDKFKNLLTEIARKNQPHSFVIRSERANVQIRKNIRHFNAKNVIGIIEGSDPVLKNECVVFMAHYDHLGIGENGDVFNGADDNGSGTVTLLEVAEAFSKQEPKPKRSLVFLWVTGEEEGMLGSKFYVENPVFPMNKTALCINIDMDGRVYEPADSVWRSSPKLVKDFDGLYTLTNNISPEIKEINSEICGKLGLIPDYSLPRGFLRSSDHYSFYIKEVPVLNYSTGYHADYHKESDEISKINFDKMKRVADLCFLVGFEVANSEKYNSAEK